MLCVGAGSDACHAVACVPTDPLPTAILQASARPPRPRPLQPASPPPELDQSRRTYRGMTLWPAPWSVHLYIDWRAGLAIDAPLLDPPRPRADVEFVEPAVGSW